MTRLSREQQLDVVALANRAPSAHNTQPARFRFEDDAVLLFEDITRRLAVGDPEGRDALTSVGTALEGLHLALGAHGLAIGETISVDSTDTSRYSASPSLRCRARSTIRPGAPESLSAMVHRRQSYRGRFVPTEPSALVRLVDVARAGGDVTLITDSADIGYLADLHEASSHHVMRDNAFQAEVYEWMRLSPTDPRWHRDGLTADCLAMNPAERAVAGIVMRPRVFSMLDTLGVIRPLITEAPQVRSAAAIAVLHRPGTEPGIDIGRRFYRFWLEITAAGFHACPMSALSDLPVSAGAIRARWKIPPDRRLVNVFRIGTAPSGEIPRSPRLPAAELLV